MVHSLFWSQPNKNTTLTRPDEREDHTVEIEGKKAVIVGGASGMAKASAEVLGPEKTRSDEGPVTIRAVERLAPF